jgi:hypothetical protein
MTSRPGPTNANASIRDDGGETHTPPREAGAPFSITDRETFYAAIERHQRASWRVTAACAAAVAVLAIVVAILSRNTAEMLTTLHLLY